MADNVKLTIDGKEVAAPKGMNLIEAAKLVGIEVPHYCYHPKLTIAGNCRMCLCDVGMPKLDKDKKPEIGPDGKPVIMFAPKLEIFADPSRRQTQLREREGRTFEVDFFDVDGAMVWGATARMLSRLIEVLRA